MSVSIYIDPFSHHFEQNRLFDRRGDTGASDNALAPYIYLRDWFGERGVEMHTADLLEGVSPNGRTNVYLSFGIRHRYRQLARRPDVVVSSLFAFECPIVEPDLYRELAPASRVFRRLLSFSTAEALAPFLTGPVTLERFQLPQFYEDVHAGIWDRDARKFLVIINGNKVPQLSLNELYSERLRALEFFDRYDEIDLYGVGWDGPAFRVGRRSRLPGPLLRARRPARRALHRLLPPRDAVGRAVRRTYRVNGEKGGDARLVHLRDLFRELHARRMGDRENLRLLLCGNDPDLSRSTGHRALDPGRVLRRHAALFGLRRVEDVPARTHTE